MVDLSIILPSIYPERVMDFWQTIHASVVDRKWELIVVGPKLPLGDLDNTRFIQDWGNVSRCVQIGSMFARGRYLTWNSDDAHLVPGGYSDAITMMDNYPSHDGCIMRYFEAVGREGQLPDDSYWTAWTHADQRLPGIPQEYKCCPVGLYSTEYFREVGGLDCRFMHANMNCHSLAFRLQDLGGIMHLSPGCIMECEFDNATNEMHKALDIAYALNDRPLYQQMYSQPHGSIPTHIDYLNWMEQPSHWERFSGF